MRNKVVCFVFLIILLVQSYGYAFTENNVPDDSAENFTKGFGIKIGYAVLKGEFASLFEDSVYFGSNLTFNVLKKYNVWLDIDVGYSNHDVKNKQYSILEQLIFTPSLRYNIKLVNPVSINFYSGTGLTYVILKSHSSELHYIKHNIKVGTSIETTIIKHLIFTPGVEYYFLFDEEIFKTILFYCSINYRTF